MAWSTGIVAVPPNVNAFQMGRRPVSPEMIEANGHFTAKNWSEAAKAYEAIVKKNPDDGVAWHRLGYSLHALGKLDRAIEAHKKTAEFPRLRRTGRYNLGCAYALKGRPDDAFKALHQAVDAGFRDVSLFRSDADLTGLRKDPRYAKLLARLESNQNDPAKRRQLDFWVGEWDVLNRQGGPAGVNRIEKQENGYLIYEQWTSSGGNTGRSMNYYDPDADKWRQVWIDSGGEIIHFEGGIENGAMVYVGPQIHRDGRKELVRTTLTPQPDGRVIHRGDISEDDGKTWQLRFELTYVPRGDSKKPDATASASE
ncbi:MAG: tetratricopeptide repeat protein [Phycisphaerae bacterium]